MVLEAAGNEWREGALLLTFAPFFPLLSSSCIFHPPSSTFAQPPTHSISPSPLPKPNESSPDSLKYLSAPLPSLPLLALDQTLCPRPPALALLMIDVLLEGVVLLSPSSDLLPAQKAGYKVWILL